MKRGTMIRDNLTPFAPSMKPSPGHSSQYIVLVFEHVPEWGARAERADIQLASSIFR